jgi:uncharacterized membrane protein (DUF2068 family)
MSTDLITYLNYMSTWDTESDNNISKLIDEHNLFVNLGNFDSDAAVDKEFGIITDLATTLRNETISANAIQIAADAAAVASIWSFGLGMAAFAALETAHAIQVKYMSSKSAELNKKLTTTDEDISAQINPNVNLYILQYKANNTLIASKAPAGLDTRTCRSLLMQFMAQLQKKNKGKLDAAGFRKYAESARILYNSTAINKVYDGLDELNISQKTDNDVQKLMNVIKGLGFDTTQMTMVREMSTAIMVYKLKIANTTIEQCAKAAGLDVAEVEASSFGMLDAMGKFFATVAVIMSVVDAVLDIIDIVDVVQQTKAMCDQLNGPIKESYKSFFNGIKTASQAYNDAMAQVVPP